MNPVAFLLHRDPLRETLRNLWHTKIILKELPNGHIRGSIRDQLRESVMPALGLTMCLESDSCKSPVSVLRFVYKQVGELKRCSRLFTCQLMLSSLQVINWTQIRCSYNNKNKLFIRLVCLINGHLSNICCIQKVQIALICNTKIYSNRFLLKAH